MRLRALRGATTGEKNDADAILDGTEELVREVMERNHLHPDDMVSCIFTCTDDPDAEVPAVAARRLAGRSGRPASRVAVGNGSCELLLSAGEALLEPGAEVVYAWPSFSVYPHLAAASGARAVTVPLDADGRHDLEAMAREVTHATRLVLICNPNNPTATAVPIDEVDAFVGGLPRHVAVVLDEA